MKHNFTVEEVNFICIFEGKSRSKAIEDMERALPHLDDPDMVELSNRVIGKLRGRLPPSAGRQRPRPSMLGRCSSSSFLVR